MKYVISKGDTLSQIARKFGVDMRKLASANKIKNPDKIYLGQELSIPQETRQAEAVQIEKAMASKAPPARVAQKETPKKDVTFSLFSRAYADDEVSPSDLYKVKKGDTLSAISKSTGTSLDDLKKLNPEITDPRKIQIGQNIRLRTESTPLSGFFSTPEKVEPIIPTNIKQLIKDVFGSDDPITEDNLKASEIEALKQAVTTARKRGSSAIEYEDYGTQSEGESQYADVTRGASILGKIADPSYSMKTFIGQGGITQNEKGETIVLDRYNFNDAVDGSLVDFLQGAAKAGMSLYGQARNIGKYFGSAPGEGSPIAINLGKI